MAAGLEASSSFPGSSQIFSPKTEKTGEMEVGGCSLVLLLTFLFFSETIPFHPHSYPLSLAFSLDFMVVPETCLVWGILGPTQCSLPSLRSLIIVVLVSSWLT